MVSSATLSPASTLWRRGEASGRGKRTGQVQTVPAILCNCGIVEPSSVITEPPFHQSALATNTTTNRLLVSSRVPGTTGAAGKRNTYFLQNSPSGFLTADELGYGAPAPEEVTKMFRVAFPQPVQASFTHCRLRLTPQPF